MSYRLSFFTFLGFAFVVYWLFLGYYNEHAVIYIIIYILFSILFDLAFVGLNLFTSMILLPIIYSGNAIFNIIGMVLIIVSVILRMVLIINLFSYRTIPTSKTILYFIFWGQEVRLNRRSKNLSASLNREN